MLNHQRDSVTRPLLFKKINKEKTRTQTFPSFLLCHACLSLPTQRLWGLPLCSEGSWVRASMEKHCYGEEDYRAVRGQI